MTAHTSMVFVVSTLRQARCIDLSSPAAAAAAAVRRKRSTPAAPAFTPTQPPSHASFAVGSGGETLLLRVFAVTDTLSRVETTGLAALAGCSEGHVRALFRRNKGWLRSALSKAGRWSDQQPQQGALAPDDGAGPASPGPSAMAVDARGAKSPLRALSESARSKILGASGAAGGGVLREASGMLAVLAGSSEAAGSSVDATLAPRLTEARQLQVAQLSCLLDPATGGLASLSSASRFVAAMQSTTSFVVRRRFLAALRATTNQQVLQRVNGLQLLHTLVGWAAEGEAEGHATFLEELMRVRGAAAGVGSAGVWVVMACLHEHTRVQTLRAHTCMQVSVHAHAQTTTRTCANRLRSHSRAQPTWHCTLFRTNRW